MWQDMFTADVALLEKVLRTTLAYFLVLVLLRVAGKRGLASTNTLDLIVLLLLASGLDNAIVGDDMSVLGGVVSATTLVVLNAGMNHLTTVSSLAARIIEGTSTTVIVDGRIREGRLRRLGLRNRELEHAIRSQNGDDISEIAHGEITPSGQIVLTLKHDEQSATKADVAALSEELRRIRELLSARQ